MRVAAIVGISAVAMSLLPGPAQAGPGNGRGNGKGRVVVRDHRGNSNGERVVVSAQRGGNSGSARRVVVPARPNGQGPVVRDHRRNTPNRQGRGRAHAPGQRKKQVIVRDHRGRVVSRNGRVIVRAQPGRGYGRDRRIVILPPRSRDEADAFAAELFARHAERLSCEQMGDLLRNISNEVLSASTLPPEVISPYDSPFERRRKEQINRLKYMLTRPAFAQVVMERLTVAFEGCDKLCFDDGVAVGVLSGMGYCNASVGLDGLPDDGFRFQDALPVCETATFVGCQQGYAQAVNSVQGCLSYATGPYLDTYNHAVSQDCNMDSPDLYDFDEGGAY